jgi:hypothetical protein
MLKSENKSPPRGWLACVFARAIVRSTKSFFFSRLTSRPELNYVDPILADLARAIVWATTSSLEDAYIEAGSALVAEMPAVSSFLAYSS